MRKWGHHFYISVLVLIELLVLFYLINKGQGYYNLPLEERPFNEFHKILKPGGLYGHGYGILGTLLIIIGVFGYMIRKRVKIFYRWGRLKYWLEFHIFLCTLGPMLIVFHSAFKFGGLISISFWSMVIVVLSGVIGRFIYIQIPRSTSGEELSENEIIIKQSEISNMIQNKFNLKKESLIDLNIVIDNIKKRKQGFFQLLFNFRILINKDKKQIQELFENLKMDDQKLILSLVKKEIQLSRKSINLDLMKKLFSYWHVAHLPFALIMLAIAIVHIAVAIAFGYTWEF